jgi:excisionase family DNA binding protein
MVCKPAGLRPDINPQAIESVMDRQTLSIMKACEVVGVSRRTIYNWISAGKVEYVRTAGGSIRIFADSLWRDPADPGRPTSASAPVAGPPA